MSWSGLLNTHSRATYKHYVARFEDSGSAHWLVRLYDGDRVVAEAIGVGPESAVLNLVVVLREQFHDPRITLDDFDWVEA